MRPLPFFLYGTLMDPDLLRRVTGAPPVRTETARLPGWRRAAMARRRYPLVIRRDGCVVPGLLAHGIGRAGARRLWRYEQPDYTIRAVRVVVADGRRVAAQIFVPLPHLRAGRPWSLAQWQRRWKSRALTRTEP